MSSANEEDIMNLTKNGTQKLARKNDKKKHKGSILQVASNIKSQNDTLNASYKLLIH